MPLTSHTTRREGTYYFRMRVPSSLRKKLGKDEICYSLRTKEPAEAKRRAYIHSYRVSSYFNDLQMGHDSAVVPTYSSMSSCGEGIRFEGSVMPTDISRESIPLASTSMSSDTFRCYPMPSDATPPTAACSSDGYAKGIEKHRRVMPTFSEIYGRYLKERNLPASSKLDYDGIVSRFIKIIGDKPISSYTIDDIRKVKDVLLELPAHIKDIKSINSFELLISKCKTENENYRKISPITVYKGIKNIGTIFNYAISNGYIDSNPTTNIKVYYAQTEPVKRLPFTTEDINKIFCSEFFKGKKTKLNNNKILDYKMMCILAFFTGARMEELARLTKDDFGIEDSIYYIYIHNDASTNRRVKNPSSIRRIPLPAKLIELGFDQFYQKIKSQESPYIFSSMFTLKEVAGKVSHYFSKWFASFLDSIGITDDKKNFHSFRHTMKRMMRDAGIEKAIADAYQGHSTGDVASSYGRDEYNMGYGLRILKVNIDRLDYSEIDFTFIKQAIRISS